jgi:hypothetical protein
MRKAMHALRWKSRFRSGNADIDRDNKAVVECLNSLIDATRQRQHCREIEDLLEEMAEQADTLLSTGEQEVRAVLRTHLMAKLPLPNYQTQSCHTCGICDLAQAQIASHLQAPAQCLALAEKKTDAS